MGDLIGIDKVLHLSLSANLTLGLTALLLAAGVPRTPALLFATGITLGIGALKELAWDWAMGRGTPDPIDFAFDVMGAGCAVVGIGIAFSVP